MIARCVLATLLLLFLSPVRAQHPVIPSKDTLAPAHPMIDDSAQYRMEEYRKNMAAQMEKAAIDYFVIHVPDEKFGYSIFIDGQMYIEQKTIPAVQGNAGFAAKEDAEQVAKLVISKIRQGEMPPAVTKEELAALGIQ